MTMSFDWAIVVLERELSDLQQLYSDETVKKDGKQTAVALKYAQVEAAIKKLRSETCSCSES